MRSRLITLAIMIGLAVALFQYARNEDLINTPRPTSGLLFPGFNPQVVNSLYLGMAVGQYLQLEREPGGPWLITQPTQERALPVLVEVVLDNLLRATVQPVESRGETVRAEDVGLEPPLYQIRFGHDDHIETLLLGEVDALGSHVYARRMGDDQIVLTTRNIITLLLQHGESFVDVSLFRGLAGAVDSVRVEDADGVVMAARRVADRWTLTEPEAVLADETRVDKLVRSLQFVRSTRVIHSRPGPQDLRAYGLPDTRSIDEKNTRGATMVQVGAAGEVPVRVWFETDWHSQAEEVAALRDEPWKVVAVERSALAVLGNSTEWYRDHRLLPPVRERANSLRLEQDGTALMDIHIEPGGTWRFSAPDRLAGEPVESERLDGHSPLIDYLSRLDSFEVLGFTEPPKGEPVARLVVGWTRAGQDRTDRVDLYPAREDGLVPARSTIRLNEGLLLSPEVLELFDPGAPDLLRSTSPLSVDEQEWTRLLIHHPALAGPLKLTREAVSGRWAGDDAWGRRYGLGSDLQTRFRGFAWQPTRPGAGHPWRVEFLDADGGLLAGLGFRRPEPDEPQETFGAPAAMALIDGRPGVELIVARDWLDRIEELSGPQLRKP
jgi:hypothetical protein